MSVMHREIDWRESSVEVRGWTHGTVERLLHVAPRVKAVWVERGHHVGLGRVRPAVVEGGCRLMGPVLEARVIYTLVEELVCLRDVDVVPASACRGCVITSPCKQAKGSGCCHMRGHAHRVVRVMVVVRSLRVVLARHRVHAKPTCLEERVGVRRPRWEQWKVRGGHISGFTSCRS